jgi:hypothetical protein
MWERFGSTSAVGQGMLKLRNSSLVFLHKNTALLLPAFLRCQALKMKT